MVRTVGSGRQQASDNGVREGYSALGNELVIQRGLQSGPLLVCIPHAGGSARTYLPWRGLLPEDLCVVAVELPGHGRRIRERPLNSIEVMARYLIDSSIRERSVGRKLYLYGHSMGALVAYSIACLLWDEGQPCSKLIVSGSRGPHDEQRIPCERVHELNDADLKHHLSDLQGTPAGLLEQADLLSLFMPGIRADFEACETYLPEARTGEGSPTLVLFGTDDATTDSSGTNGWDASLDFNTTYRYLAGGHFFNLDRQNGFVDAVAAFITADKDAVFERKNCE